MTWLFGILTALFILDAFRLRARLSPLPKAPRTEEPLGDYVLLTHDSARVSEQAARDAAAWARSEGVEVADLVPQRWSAVDALVFAQLVEVGSFRKTRFATGRSALVGAVVHKDVAARLGDPSGPMTAVQWVHFAERLKRYAPATMAHVMVDGAEAASFDGGRTRAVMHAIGGGGGVVIAALAIPVLVGIFAWGFVSEPLMATIALGAWHLQPLLATAGVITAPDLPVVTLLRLPMELFRWASIFLRGGPPSERRRKLTEARPVYEALVKDGVEQFLEPRRSDCPICGSDQIAKRLEVGDLLQLKPGRFRLDHCGACGHIFQNPRLNIDGLNYYYKDFYDGFGEKELESIFSFSAEPYEARARTLQGQATPTRWLDVGGGHGHFCCAARDIWPEARFDGLDMSESIDEAIRRRWVDKGYRGLFPEMAGDTLPSGSYDVVSMSHYLEHTREPREEIQAAAKVLEKGGHLLIEVPDPEARTARILNRLWLPFFQPQHQHLVPLGLLEKVMAEEGFTTVVRHRGEAHQPVDVLFAVSLSLTKLAGKIDVPWKPPSTAVDRVRHYTVWALGMPFVGVAWAIDQILSPVLRRPGWSNTYRVLARLDNPPG